MRLALAMVLLAFILVTLAAASLTDPADRPSADSAAVSQAGMPLGDVASAATKGLTPQTGSFAQRNGAARVAETQTHSPAAGIEGFGRPDDVAADEAGSFGVTPESDPVLPAGTELDRPRMMPGESQVIRSGNVLWISGQLGRDTSGWGQNPKEQAQIALDNLTRILTEHGATLEDVVDLTTYHRDLKDVSVFSDVKRRIFASAEPAWTAVGVSNLVHPEMLLELKAVAVLR